MWALVVSRFGVEMSSDPIFLPRVRRLALTSAVVLGWIWVLAVGTLNAHPAIEIALLLGWVGMPAVLGLSLRLAWIRRLVAFPSALMTAALVAVCLFALPDDDAARAGWLLLTAGILFGAGLGVWFWYRWLPVPEPLDAPFAPARWVLIAVHVGLVVAGLLLIAVGELV
jgi:hypothetical protein